MVICGGVWGSILGSYCGSFFIQIWGSGYFDFNWLQGMFIRFVSRRRKLLGFALVFFLFRAQNYVLGRWVTMEVYLLYVCLLYLDLFLCNMSCYK